jgi:hypothetical protein
MKSSKWPNACRLQTSNVWSSLLNPPKTIEQLAEEQGVGPFDWDRAAARARRIWPEDESIDESRRDRGPERRID